LVRTDDLSAGVLDADGGKGRANSKAGAAPGSKIGIPERIGQECAKADAGEDDGREVRLTERARPECEGSPVTAKAMIEGKRGLVRAALRVSMSQLSKARNGAVVSATPSQPIDQCGPAMRVAAYANATPRKTR
jgi:hypothetical protein